MQSVSPSYRRPRRDCFVAPMNRGSSQRQERMSLRVRLVPDSIRDLGDGARQSQRLNSKSQNPNSRCRFHPDAPRKSMEGGDLFPANKAAYKMSPYELSLCCLLNFSSFCILLCHFVPLIKSGVKSGLPSDF